MRHFQWVPTGKEDLFINIDRIISVEQPAGGATGCIITVDGFEEPVWCDYSAYKFVEDLYTTQREDTENVPTVVDGHIRIISED